MHASVLRYFSAVVDCGSIRKAAESLNVASSAVNRQILKLEDGFGVPLFDRTPSGVRLTAAGEILLRHVEGTLRDFERAQAEIHELQGLKTGLVQVAALESLLVDFLPHVVEDFSRAHPGVTYAVNQRSPADVVEDVAIGHAEIGISFANVASPSVRLLAEIDMPIGVVLAADHPLAGETEIRLEDCGQYPILLMPDVAPMRPMIEQDFSRAGLLVDPKVVTNSLDMMKHLVAAGTGIAFFTRLAFAREIARGELVHVALVDADVARLKIAIMVQRDRRLSPAADSFVDFMTARFLAL